MNNIMLLEYSRTEKKMVVSSSSDNNNRFYVKIVDNLYVIVHNRIH